MPKIAIEDKGCRGCQLCVDTCPVEVFEFDAAAQLAKVVVEENCISCLSCAYACPSQCLTVKDYETTLPLHRIEEDVELVERFLQVKAAASVLTEVDCDAALRDVSTRLHALAQTILDTMGRGYGVVGRRAGSLAAEHLPEMYEGNGLDEVLGRLQKRFASSFEFDYKIGSDGGVDMTFHPCCLGKVVQGAGQKVGEAGLCMVFHEYWAGLIGAFADRKRCTCKVPVAGETCQMKLSFA
jgi:NAD-dependent dihydropyrimidine dehydrogenase PreA subunit